MDILHICYFIKKPSVLTYHADVTGIYRNFLYGFVRRLFLGKVNLIVLTSKNYLESSVNLDQYRKKIKIIPIGIDKKPEELFQRRFNNLNSSHDTEKYFLFLGEDRSYKGIDILIEAAAISKCKVIIAGKIKRESLSNTHNLIFMGEVSDAVKNELLSKCYGLILSSTKRSEAYGIVMLEASQYGKPLICTELRTGTTYINLHNQTGYVVKPGDANDLAHAMKRLWENESTARKFGNNAKKRFDELFTSDVMVNKYIEMYKRILF